MVKVFPLPLFIRVEMRDVFSALSLSPLWLKSSLSPSLPLKSKKRFCLSMKSSPQTIPPSIAGQIIHWYWDTWSILRLQQKSKRRSMCMEIALEWASVSVCALGWMEKNRENLCEGKRRKNFTTEQHSTGKMFCVMPCHCQTYDSSFLYDK